MAFDTSWITNPAAYGSVPRIPATTTNVATTGWTPSFPQYPELAGAASTVAGTQLAGEFDPEDIVQMRREAAEMGVQTGAPGSPNATARYLASYLLGRAKMRQQGMQSYLNLLAQSPRTQTQSQTVSNNVLQAMYAAAPQPYAAAMANLQAQRSGLGAGLGAFGGGGGGGRQPAPMTEPAVSRFSEPTPAAYGPLGVGGESMYPGYRWNTGTQSYERTATQPMRYAGAGTAAVDRNFYEEMTGEAWGPYMNTSAWGTPREGGTGTLTEPAAAPSLDLWAEAQQYGGGPEPEPLSYVPGIYVGNYFED